MRIGIGALASLAGVAPAAAIELDIAPEAELTLLGVAQTRDGARVLGGLDARVGAEVSALAQNGVRVGLRGVGALQVDGRDRIGFGRLAGQCPVAFAACASADAGFGAQNVRSPVTGFFAGGDLDAPSALIGAERAYGFVEFGWGEVSFGRDIGIAERFASGGPPALARGLGNAVSVDVDGLAVVKTIADPSGVSAKITYVTPRILGLRLGASLTPRARADSVDAANPENGADRPVSFQPNWVGEFGASFARRLGTGPRLSASAAVTHAADGGAIAAFDGWTQASFGAQIAWSAVEIGGSALWSDNGWAPSGRQTWSAEAGFAWTPKDWRLRVGGGWTEDQLAGVSGGEANASLTRAIGKHLEMGLGLSFRTRRVFETVNGGLDRDQESSVTGLLEIRRKV